MSDLLEDQKIAYIVKDYRRMFDMHEQLVNAVKEATKVLKHKDNRIRDLERQVTNLQTKMLNALTVEKGALVRRDALLARDQFLSLKARAEKGAELLNSLLENMKELPIEDHRFDDINTEDYEKD